VSGSLRDINQYNRIVRQGLIEEATKKSISWANQRIFRLSNACTRKKSGSNEASMQEKSSVNKESTGSKRYHIGKVGGTSDRHDVETSCLKSSIQTRHIESRDFQVFETSAALRPHHRYDSFAIYPL